MEKVSNEKRTKRRTGGLKKHQQLENVIVEEPFNLSSQKKLHGKVGEGVYVSATAAGNKRYYGVLIDQPALKEATSLWLEDQSDSLELNKRIRALQHQAKDVSKHTSADDVVNHEEEDEAAARSNNSKGDEHTMNLLANDSQVAQDMGNSAETTMSQSTPATAITTSSANAVDAGLGKRFMDQATGSILAKTAEIEGAGTKKHGGEISFGSNERPIQKFKYAYESNMDAPGYRTLVATFANVEEAASGNMEVAKSIYKACEEGGNYLPGCSTYYYQYEVLPTVLTSAEESLSEYDIRTSMGLHTFLQNTNLPPWYPLSNLQTRHGRVLNMLNMKKDNKGNIKWDSSSPDVVASNENAAVLLAGGTKVTMQPREKKSYQIGVVGGGIAGVACCRELATRMERAGVEYHITLFEARGRLGGRIWTDHEYQADENGTIPIELGASWIHGIDDNPLASLAQEAGIEFVTASEEVQMFGEGMRKIDSAMDERAGKLFDNLLDLAADECWSAPEIDTETKLDRQSDPQAAVRWYASVFVDKVKDSSCLLEDPPLAAPPAHRLSSDRSIDVEMGKAILNHKLGKMTKLSNDERRMLVWNTKNVEYALGANISDLSMKYWDADERHAFEGDHVMLKQGYSTVIDHMIRSTKAIAGDKFEVLLDFPVGQLEYARKTTSIPHGRDRLGRTGKLVELSDTCSVSSQDGSITKYFDFVVCACPLGVLKESVQDTKERKDVLRFQPPLPFSKTDAINNVGFGLLDKIYLTFPSAFWRDEGFFQADDQFLFGNVSGLFPHHYMFFDIGRCLGSGDKAPPILMSLISGREAVACECLPDDGVLKEVLSTLRAIFPVGAVPEPISYRFTRWGEDKYSRGSYTFLPPGTTEQDFNLLQSPINGNGDSLVLDGSETMRLFFAGEHTTALHPSMAHGAMLSGMRAAREIVSTIHFKLDEDKNIDRIIPMALFRWSNPHTKLRCSLCSKIGGQIREGSLIAFKRGAREVLVHNNCAEYSPEVEVLDSKWKNVIKAVNRGKLLQCTVCGGNGATIGCTSVNCYRVYHFSCSEDAGWRFERDGKVFYCDLHRNQAQDYVPYCDRISMNVYTSKNPKTQLTCRLCGHPENDDVLGQLLAFQYGRRQACVHEKCIKYTSICDTSEDEDSRMGREYKGVFVAIETSRKCKSCNRPGATARCVVSDCDGLFHITCAIDGGWNFEKRGKGFRCQLHRKTLTSAMTSGQKRIIERTTGGKEMATEQSSEIAGFFNHSLIAKFGATSVDPYHGMSMPGHHDIGKPAPALKNDIATERANQSDRESYSSDESDIGAEELEVETAMDIPLSSSPEGLQSSLKTARSSTLGPWGLVFSVVKIDGSYKLSLLSHDSPTDAKQFVESINGMPVGEGDLLNLRSITRTCLQQETELTLGITSLEEKSPQPRGT